MFATAFAAWTPDIREGEQGCGIAMQSGLASAVSGLCGIGTWRARLINWLRAVAIGAAGLKVVSPDALNDPTRPAVI